jgi:hypothetical protein
METEFSLSCLNLDHILMQLSPALIFTPYFSKIHFNISLPSVYSSTTWLLPLFLTKVLYKLTLTFEPMIAKSHFLKI